MKRIALASLVTLCVLGFVSPRSTNAQSGGPFANGNFKFSLEDGFAKHVEFDARTNEKGAATGQMTFTDEAKISGQDVDGTGDGAAESRSGFYIKAEFDCLSVEKNRAVMCGTISDSSHGAYVGRRVLLVVEDAGDGPEAQDRLTWGLYLITERGWFATDAEREYDEGAGLRWTATDAERRDDVGIPSHMDEEIGCRSFPVESHDLVEVKEAEGTIQVQP
ncbi:MAG: hypothetical protein H0T60_03500 [Acidobacteria bacterium]|nr:hypothetical protein [Acidobacteriota bacterium]